MCEWIVTNEIVMNKGINQQFFVYYTFHERYLVEMDNWHFVLVQFVKHFVTIGSNIHLLQVESAMKRRFVIS